MCLNEWLLDQDYIFKTSLRCFSSDWVNSCVFLICETHTTTVKWQKVYNNFYNAIECYLQNVITLQISYHYDVTKSLLIECFKKNKSIVIKKAPWVLLTLLKCINISILLLKTKGHHRTESKPWWQSTYFENFLLQKITSENYFCIKSVLTLLTSYVDWVGLRLDYVFYVF